MPATQHDPPYAILQQRHPEVDEQTKWAIHRFQVRDDLCLMNGSDHLHSLQFDDQDIFDQEIKLSTADGLGLCKKPEIFFRLSKRMFLASISISSAFS